MIKTTIIRAAFFFLLALSFTINISIFAQENEEPVDVMDMSLEELLNVEITTASKKPEKVGEIPASIVIVTRADIENYGYQTLSEVLESIPGLYQIDDYFTQNFGVRGFWTIIPQRNIIILVNGVPQTDGLTSGNWLQQINLPVEAIDRIEVVRGPMSVMYGSGAFFGVINIKTNVVEPYNPISMVSASYGSEMTHNLCTRVSGKQLDFQYAFNASYSHTDGIDIPYAYLVNTETELDELGVNRDARTQGQLKKNEKYFNFSGQFKGFSFDSSFTEADRGIIFVLPSFDEGSSQNTRAVRISFGYKKEFSDKVKMDARFGYFVNRAVYDYKWNSKESLGKPDDGTKREPLGIQNDESRAYSAEANLFLYPSRRLNITVGLNYSKILEIKNEATIPDIGINLWGISLARGASVVTQSLFTQWNYDLSRRLKIVAGIRLEQTPDYDLMLKKAHIGTGTETDPSYFSIQTAPYSHPKIEFIPRLALIYNIDGRNVIKLLYGKAINQPSFFQMAEEGFFNLNYKLIPENIQTLELNYVGQYSPELIVTASVFRNMLNSLIYRTLRVDENDAYTSSYANVGKMGTTGVEVNVQARPIEQLSLEVSATYQDTKEDVRTDPKTGDKFGVENPPGYSPHFLGYFKAAYNVAKNISLAITGNYVSPMESYYDVTLKNDKGDLGLRLGQKVDGYFLLGANLRIKKLFNTGLYLDIRGSNLLDQKVYYPATSNNFLFAPKGTVGRGISFLLTLGWKF